MISPTFHSYYPSTALGKPRFAQSDMARRTYPDKPGDKAYLKDLGIVSLLVLALGGLFSSVSSYRHQAQSLAVRLAECPDEKVSDVIKELEQRPTLKLRVVLTYILSPNAKLDRIPEELVATLEEPQVEYYHPKEKISEKVGLYIKLKSNPIYSDKDAAMFRKLESELKSKL